MKNNLDELLKQVLTPREEADELLHRKILEQVKETGNMGRNRHKRVLAASAAVALVATASITAFAALRYKSPSQMAERIGDEGLAQNFAMMESSRQENDTDWNAAGESQSFGGYRVTFLGFVSGENLSAYERRAGGELRNDRTYCAVAIEKEDGTAVNASEEQFFVSPLIGGLNPGLYNAMTLCGNYSEFVEEGVLYRLLECDNIEIFADHELYLCVTDTTFYDNGLYLSDEAAGSIARNTDYQGLNALFDLDVDSSKADPEKARALIAEIDSPSRDDGEEIEIPEEAKEAMAWGAKITPENIEEYCVRLENTVQTAQADKDGFITFTPWLVNEAISDSWGGGGSNYRFDWYFEDQTPRMVIDSYSGTSIEELVITTYTLNEDKSVTFAAWVPKDVSKALTVN